MNKYLLSISVLFSSAIFASPVWEVEYNIDAFPHTHTTWDIAKSPNSKMKVERGLLFLDTIENNNDSLVFSKHWEANASTGLIVEARLKVDKYIGAANLGGSAIWVGDDSSEEVLLITSNGISLYGSKLNYMWLSGEKMEDYHVYRIEAKNNNIKVYIDGELKIDGTGQYGVNHWTSRNWIAFGDGSRGASSKTTWDYIKYTTNP